MQIEWCVRVVCARILIRLNNVGERIRIWLAFVLERLARIIAYEGFLFCERVRPEGRFYTAETAGVTGTPVRRHRLSDGARTIVTQGLTLKGRFTPSCLAGPCFQGKNVAIFIDIPFLPTGILSFGSLCFSLTPATYDEGDVEGR